MTTFLSKVMSLLFNMLSRLVIAFFQGASVFYFHGCSHHLQWFWSPRKLLTVSIVSLFICHEVMGLDIMIFIFEIFSLKPAFSLSFFIFINRLFSSSLVSAIRVVVYAYLRLLIFLLAILTPAHASSSPAFHMMYSADKLNKQGDNNQPWRTPFTIWNQSVVPCPVLTVASWPAHTFLRRQVWWYGIPISWRIFHSSIWSTQSKGLAHSIKK